jgi:predicted NAD/FAD-binding protein
MKVAVVGSGVSGLASTWVSAISRFLITSPKLTTYQLLNEYSKHEVHLYEADNRPGGHVDTIQFSSPGKEPADVDA